MNIPRPIAGVSLFIILAVLSLTGNAQPYREHALSYGLQFASRDADPEKRTSIDLAPDESFCGGRKIVLAFELSFIPNNNSFFGYIFRIINDKKQNLDMLYDQTRSGFKIVFGDSYTAIAAPIPPEALLSRWMKFRVEIDPGKSVSLYCDDRLIKSDNLTWAGGCFKICFGASNYADFKSTDVSPMRLRNIRLTLDGAGKYYWPLNDTAGSVIHDSARQKKAIVTNGQWLQPKYSRWELLSSFFIKGSPSAGFDPSGEQVYITGTDSLYTFSAKTSLLSADPLSIRHDKLLRGNQSVFNPHNRQLYNFFTDRHFVSQYNFLQHRWDRNLPDTFLTEYWHSNKFFSGPDSSLYIVAGYGQLRYKNSVQRYSLARGTWDTVKTRGDYFAPRYLAGLGATPNGDSAYILGGYGSRNGDQLLNPKYDYDLLLYEVSSGSFKKIFSLQEPKEPFVFANSLVLDPDRVHYYALVFPKDQLNTQLQLIKGSLQQPVYELLGSPFPYTFFDTYSFADLYYCNSSQLFLAVTLHTDKNRNITEVKIYGIHSPPNPPGIAATGVATAPAPGGYAYLIAALLVAGLAFAIVRYKIKNAGQAVGRADSSPLIANDRETISTGPGPSQDARIYLFGNFEVISSRGENITKLFTPLLKELFLLLCIHSIRHNEGVSSEKLIETLWHDKEGRDAINNRSVNIAKLKSILEKTDDCTLLKESRYWKLDFNREKLYMDFDSCVRILTKGNIDKGDIQELLAITQRGAFLPQTAYQWADNIKSEISNFIVDTLLKYCHSLTSPENAERIITVCDSIFFFDELNENALQLKCKSLIALGRHALAKQAFEKFVTKYREIYGEDYPVTYQALINQ